MGRRGGLSLGALLLVLVVALVFKQDVSGLLELMAGESVPVAVGRATSSFEEERMVEFVSFVLDDVQTTWDAILPQLGVPYREATLVLFRDAVQSACGYAQAVPSIAPRIGRSTSIWHSSTSCIGASVRRVTSHKRM